MGSILISEYGSGNSQSLISLEGSNFAANGHVFLSDVPENITLTPSRYTGKSTSSESKDRHVVPIGKLRNVKFMSIFRFKAAVRPYSSFLEGLSGSFHRRRRQLREPDPECVYMHGGDIRTSDEEAMKVVNASGLLKFQENYKFRDYVSPKSLAIGSKEKGMGAFIKDLKEEFTSVDSVYVWHAFCGYWGGLRPNVPGLPPAQVVKPMTMKDLAVDKILSTGVGLVPPEIVDQMYEGLHSHLEKVGIDGVKVDVIHLLEMVCENYGGRVDMAKAYFKAFTASVRKHFKGNGVIASMEHCNDFMFLGTEAISLGRVGDDFWCTDPSGDPNGTFWLQGCHMVHCAYNSLWMGNFIHPDWDMFQSTHPCAEFHAASRAISGGPIYVSDAWGSTTSHCSRSWCCRTARFSGVITMHFRPGTASSRILCTTAKPCSRFGTSTSLPESSEHLTAKEEGGAARRDATNTKTNPRDIEWNSGKNPISIDGVHMFAMYLSQSKKLVLSKPHDNIEIALEPFNFELLQCPHPICSYRFSEHAQQWRCYPVIGLYNNTVQMGIKGSGEMRVFASEKPRACKIDGREVAFEYGECMATTQVPWSSPSGLSIVEYLF
uniref:Galactinol--sucrose galactosyltransferase n=1 Tax=Salix viminalis TaxID=40686 RepID=A0A6N2KVC8_SALVM